MDTSIDSMYSGMEDALGSTPDAPTVETVTAPVDEESTTDAPEQQPQQPVQEGDSPAGDTPNPEGPGDTAKAFQAYRAEIAAYKAQLAEQQDAAQRAAQYEAYFTQLQAQQQQAQLEQQLEQYSDDPESLAALLQSKQTEYQQQAQAQQREQALRMGADFARAAFPDFDSQIGKLYTILGPEVVDGLAAQQANGPLWAYQMAQQFRSPEEFNQAVESQVQARLAELAPRTQPKTPMSSRGIGQLPAAAANTNPHPAMSAAQALNFGPTNQGFDAAYQALLEAAGG